MLLRLMLGGAVLSAQPIAAQAPAKNAEPEKPSLECSLGPIERYYDAIQWYVFGCSDGQTIAFFTGPESPDDLNFYFIAFHDGEKYKVYGEGNGDRALTQPAYDAISNMRSEEYMALHSEALAMGSSAKPNP